MTAWRFLFVVSALSGQTQTFQGIRYQAPAGYTAKRGGEFLEFSRIDNQRNFYCQIALFPPAVSRGTPQQDMDADWQSVYAKSFQFRSTPTTRTLPLAKAPKSLLRTAAGIDGNNKTVIASMFVLAFPQQYVTVSFNVPRSEAFQACQPDINSFLSSIVVTAPPAVSAAPAAAPAAGQPAPVPLPGSIVGSWQRIDSSPSPRQYNPLTNQWTYNAAVGMNQFRNTRTYRFEANNQYTADFLLESYTRQQDTRVLETGRYTVANGVLQFQPANYQEGVAPRGQKPTLVQKPTPAPYARRFSIGEHPQYKNSAGLQFTESDGSVITFEPVR